MPEYEYLIYLGQRGLKRKWVHEGDGMDFGDGWYTWNLTGNPKGCLEWELTFDAHREHVLPLRWDHGEQRVFQPRLWSGGLIAPDGGDEETPDNELNGIQSFTVIGTITTAGDASLTVTRTGMIGSPAVIAVPVLVGDTATVVATKVRAQLHLHVAVNNEFSIGGTGATVTLTRIYPGPVDPAWLVQLHDGSCVGLTWVESTYTPGAVIEIGTPVSVYRYLRDFYLRRMASSNAPFAFEDPDALVTMPESSSANYSARGHYLARLIENSYEVAQDSSDLFIYHSSFKFRQARGWPLPEGFNS